VYWFSLELLCETFLILRTDRYMIKNVYWSSRKVPPIFLSAFNGTWILSTDFSKNSQIPNFMKIRQVGTAFFPCGGTYRHDEDKSLFAILQSRLYLKCSTQAAIRTQLSNTKNLKAARPVSAWPASKFCTFCVSLSSLLLKHKFANGLLGETAPLCWDNIMWDGTDVKTQLLFISILWYT
jgi:hypothetical protein